MKAITVCEPYASAIIGTATIPGSKRCENRPNPWRYRGPLLIHAGKSMSYMSDLEGVMRLMPGLCRADLTFGAIIGRVDLVDCLEGNVYERKYPDDPWRYGPWCLRLENAVRFAYSIPYQGQLGLFEIPDFVIEANEGNERDALRESLFHYPKDIG